MNSENFNALTRKEKDELSEKKLTEMLLKNQRLRQRHAEVERDRLMAEEQNSAITCVSKKKNLQSESSDKVKYTREWDKGKLDKEPWSSPNNSEYFKDYPAYDKKEPASYSKGFSDFEQYRHENRYEKRHENRYENRHEGRRENHRENRYENRHENRYGNRHENRYENRFENRYENPRSKARESYKRDTDHISNNQRMYQNSKKIGDDSYRRHQPSYGKRQNFNQQKTNNSHPYSSQDTSYHAPLKTSLWQNEKVQNKKSRIENWVKSVNKSNVWKDVDSSSKPYARYSKFKKFEKSASSSDSDDDKKDKSPHNTHFRTPAVPKTNKKIVTNPHFSSSSNNRHTHNQTPIKDYVKTSKTSEVEILNKNTTSNDCDPTDPWRNIVQSDIKWSDEELLEEFSDKPHVPISDENANDNSRSAKNSEHHLGKSFTPNSSMCASSSNHYEEVVTTFKEKLNIQANDATPEDAGWSTVSEEQSNDETEFKKNSVS